MQNVKRQGGSVAVFVVVGVILVLVALGIIYGMKHVAMRDQMPPMALPELFSNEDGKSDQKTDDQAGNGDDSQTSESESTRERSDQSKDQAANDDKQSGATLPGSSENPTSTDQSGSAGSSKSGNLPQSGPADTLSGAIALTAITISLTAYTRSIRRI